MSMVRTVSGPSPRPDNRHDPSAGVMGFLSCAPDAEYRTMLADLRSGAPLPVVGGTSLANPFDASGAPFVSNLAFFGKNNVRHSISVSPPLAPGGARRQIAALYRDSLEQLRQPPKVFLALFPILPDLFMDDYLEELFLLTGDVPVFGGMVSDDPGAGPGAVFAGDAVFGDRLVLVGFSGEVTPVFGCGCRMTALSGHTPLVTKAEGNVVMRVDDMSFADFIGGLGFDAAVFEESPLYILIRDAASGDGETDMVNAVVKIDPRTGNGTLSSNIAVGSRIGMGILTGDDIRLSTATAIQQLSRGMKDAEASGAAFTMVLAVSCVARYYTMSAGGRIEADLLNAGLPPNLGRFGFFASREVAPIRGRNKKSENRVIGQSIILCAL